MQTVTIPIAAVKASAQVVNQRIKLMNYIGPGISLHLKHSSKGDSLTMNSKHLTPKQALVVVTQFDATIRNAMDRITSKSSALRPNWLLIACICYNLLYLIKKKRIFKCYSRLSIISAGWKLQYLPKNATNFWEVMYLVSMVHHETFCPRSDNHNW